MIAIEYFRDLFAPNLPNSVEPNLRLEELEESDDGQFWFVTLGYDVAPRRAISDLLGETPREYKKFTIDTQSGRVTSAKIRTV